MQLLFCIIYAVVYNYRKYNLSLIEAIITYFFSVFEYFFKILIDKIKQWPDMHSIKISFLEIDCK